MPLWFAVSTAVILAGTGVGVRLVHRRWVARQEAEYEGFSTWGPQEQRDFLLKLSRRKLHLLGWVLSAVSVVGVIGVWYVGGSMLLIGHNADETNEQAEALRVLVLELEEERVERAFNLCLFMNSVQHSNRQGRLGDIAATSRFLLRNGTDQAVVDDLANDRLVEIPPVEDTDRDCNENGVIGDEGDYLGAA